MHSLENLIRRLDILLIGFLCFTLITGCNFDTPTRPPKPEEIPYESEDLLTHSVCPELSESLMLSPGSLYAKLIWIGDIEFDWQFPLGEAALINSEGKWFSSTSGPIGCFVERNGDFSAVCTFEFPLPSNNFLSGDPIDLIISTIPDCTIEFDMP
jgi:hypothetical protein